MNGHLGQFPADPQAAGEMSRITRFLVSGDTWAGGVETISSCSPRCKLAAIDGLIERLTQHRAALVATLDAEPVVFGETLSPAWEPKAS